MTLAGLPYPQLAAIEGAVAAVNITRKEAAKPRRHPIWWIMLPVCIIGVVISDGVLYSIGRFGGTHLLGSGWVKKRLMPPDKPPRSNRTSTSTASRFCSPACCPASVRRSSSWPA